MGSIDVYTAAYEALLHDDDIVSGTVNGSGHLILTKRGGGTIDAGSVIGPAGAAGSNVRLWDIAVGYITGDVVAFSGRLYKALNSNTNKCPPLYQTNWQPISGAYIDQWPSIDPYFLGDQLSNAWETFWKTGTSTVSITTAGGEFETMGQGAKVVLGASSSQRLYEKAEVLVTAGEYIQVRARVKLSVTAPQFTMECQLLQNDKLNTPAPLSTGLSVTSGGDLAATNGWTWLTWTIAVVDAKPRAMVNLIPKTTAVGGATAFIDRVEIRRYKDQYSYPIDWTGMTLINGWLHYDTGVATPPNPLFGSGRPAMYMRHPGGQMELEGIIRSGVIGNNPFFIMPAGTRCRAMGGALGERHFAAASNSAFGIGQANSDGMMRAQVGSNAWFDLNCFRYKAEA